MVGESSDCASRTAVVFGPFVGDAMALLLHLPLAPLVVAGALAGSIGAPISAVLICAEFI